MLNNEQYKINRLIEQNVDYMIDDDSQICNNAANRIDKDKVINVNNWGEIYKHLILNDNKY